MRSYSSSFPSVSHHLTSYILEDPSSSTATQQLMALMLPVQLMAIMQPPELPRLVFLAPSHTLPSQYSPLSTSGYILILLIVILSPPATHHPTATHGAAGTHTTGHDYAAGGAHTDPRTTGQKVKDAITPGDQGAQYRNDGSAASSYATNDPAHHHAGTAGTHHQPYTGTTAETGTSVAHHDSRAGVDHRTTGQKLKDGLTGSHDKHNGSAAPGYSNNSHQPGAGTYGQHGTASGAPYDSTAARGSHAKTSSGSGGGLLHRSGNNDPTDINEVLRQEAQAKKEMEEAIARHNAAHQTAGSRLQSQEEQARAEYEQAERRLREAEAFRKQHGH